MRARRSTGCATDREIAVVAAVLAAASEKAHILEMIDGFAEDDASIPLKVVVTADGATCRGGRGAAGDEGERGAAAHGEYLPGTPLAGRVRQWLGAVPAAGAWAARQSLPLADTVDASRSSGERRTAPGRPVPVPAGEEERQARIRRPSGVGWGLSLHETPGAGDGGARERGASSHRRCGQDQYAIVPQNRSVSASVTPMLPAPVACANRPVPPVACQKIATSSMTSGFGHG